MTGKREGLKKEYEAEMKVCAVCGREREKMKLGSEYLCISVFVHDCKESITLTKKQRGL